jgi:hypothetical protein
MSTPSIAADIHVTAAADTVLSDANKIEGIRELSFPESTTLNEEQYLNDAGVDTYTPVRSQISWSMSGDVKMTSATQGVLRDANDNKTAFYVHVLTDPEADAGEQGKRYKCFVESYEAPLSAAEVIKLSASGKVSGAPTAV